MNFYLEPYVITYMPCPLNVLIYEMTQYRVLTCYMLLLKY